MVYICNRTVCYTGSRSVRSNKLINFMFLLKVAGESEKRLEKRAGDLLVVRLMMAMMTVKGRKGPVSETVVRKGRSSTCLSLAFVIVPHVFLVSFPATYT